MIRYLLLLQLLVIVSGLRWKSPNLSLFVYKGQGRTPAYRFTRNTYNNRDQYQQVSGRNAEDGDISYLRAYREIYEEKSERSFSGTERVGGFTKRMHMCRGTRNGETFHLIWEQGKGDSDCPLNTYKDFDFYAAVNDQNKNGAVKLYYIVCEPSNGGAPYSRIVDSGGSNKCLGDDEQYSTPGSFFAMKGKLICENRAAPTNGRVVNSHSEHAVRLTEIRYECYSGYRMSGSPTVRCRNNGLWNNEVPQCQSITCNRPDHPRHGQVPEGNYEYLDRVSYLCDEGYELYPRDSVIRCQSNGQWTNSQMTCQPKTCGFPGSIRNGDISGGGYTYGDEVTFYCDDGYAIDGARTARCESDGHWNAQPPVCNRIRCPLLPQPENGVLHGGSERFLGREVIFSCHTGYLLQGSPTLLCERNGNTGDWNGAPPQCQAIACDRPVAPANGGVLGTDFSYGASVTFTCDLGYTMLGSDIATCQTNGWDSRPPTCEVKNCGDLEAPEHGYRLGNSSTYGELLKFGCDEGYNLKGPKTILCEEEGRWTGRAPTCQAVACMPLGVPAHGSRAGEDFTFGSEVSFSCFPGYELVGTEVTTCQANGQWTSPPPTCRACEVGSYKEGGGPGSCVQCPDLSSTTSTASFSPLHCMCEDGTQKTEEGGCEVISCEELPALPNGRRVGCTQGGQATCTWSCGSGFILHGSRDRRCTTDGWTGTPPSCTACPENKYKREEGSLSCTPCPTNTLTNDRLGTSIEACQCRPGFQQKEDMSCEDIDECAVENGGCNHACENMDGSYRCYCNIPGWQLLNDQKTCTQVQSCPVITEQPGHGSLECHYVESENGNTCFIKCDSNYFFVSGENNYITCGDTTNYTWSHQLVNATARLPSCMEEYFSDVQLPMSITFIRGDSGGSLRGDTVGSLDEEELRHHLEEVLRQLDEECPTCEVPGITITNSSSSSEVLVDFHVFVPNPHPDPVLPDCGLMCKSGNMRLMIRKVFLVSQALEKKAEQQPDELAFQDVDVSLSVKNDSVTKGRPQIICEPGKVSTRLRLCVPCEPGYYLASRTDTTCSKCARGSFQDESGQVLCKPCPEGLTTVGKGAYHHDQCLVRVVETHIPSAGSVENGTGRSDSLGQVPPNRRR